CGDDRALDLGEVPADLADHKVAGHEPDVRVDRGDVPGARDVARDLDSFGRHGVSLDCAHDVNRRSSVASSYACRMICSFSSVMPLLLDRASLRDGPRLATR